MHENILTIELDIVMKPCINLYNDMVSVINPNKLWDDINRVRQLDEHADFDRNIFNIVVKIFTRSIKDLNKENIYFIQNHDAVLFGLTEREDLFEIKYNIYII